MTPSPYTQYSTVSTDGPLSYGNLGIPNFPTPTVNTNQLSSSLDRINRIRQKQYDFMEGSRQAKQQIGAEQLGRNLGFIGNQLNMGRDAAYRLAASAYNSGLLSYMPRPYSVNDYKTWAQFNDPVMAYNREQLAPLNMAQYQQYGIEPSKVYGSYQNFLNRNYF